MKYLVVQWEHEDRSVEALIVAATEIEIDSDHYLWIEKAPVIIHCAIPMNADRYIGMSRGLDIHKYKEKSIVQKDEMVVVIRNYSITNFSVLLPNTRKNYQFSGLYDLPRIPMWFLPQFKPVVPKEWLEEFFKA